MKKMISKLFEKLDRKRIVFDKKTNEPYLERYYIFLKNRKWFPFNIFVHKFLKSDPDDLHDHPWSYATLILRGGYYEYTPIFKFGIVVGQEKHWRKPGHFRICSSTSFHRIELKPDVECWTLFMPGIQQREWGFLVNNKWVNNKKYLEN